MADPQLESLARRVQWLDRYRRGIAVITAIALATFLLLWLPGVLGTDWPVAQSRLIAIIAGVASWLVIEIVLAWIAAVWETDHDRALRDRGMPQASLLRWRRPGRRRK